LSWGDKCVRDSAGENIRNKASSGALGLEWRITFNLILKAKIWDVVDYINLAQSKNHFRTVLKAVINFRDQQSVMTMCGINSFSRRTVFR
jgi:hypothetical protein